MKILIVEDEEKLAKLLKEGLKKEGISADYLLDGEAGQKRIELYHKDYDLMILDLMLPKKNGIEVCTGVREYGITNPILVLTAKDDLQDKVALLNAGADDYMVKPFSLQELTARVRAILRRPKPMFPVELKTGPLHMNVTTRKVVCGEKEANLTLKEFALLEYFMRHPNEVIERERLITNVWDFDVELFNNIVDVYINKLRKKLTEGRIEGIIETIRGIGYKLNA